jgi:hypothetical protein
MPTIFFRSTKGWIPLLGVLIGLGAIGCEHLPIDVSRGPAPLREPRPGPDAETYEGSLTGGEVFAMYCNQCHNARAVAERPFANYQNAAAHMRVRATLTGEEYEKLLAFLQRMHDVPQPPTPPVEPSPKRLIFAQPVAELRDQIAPQADPAAAAQPQPAPAPGGAQAPPAPAVGVEPLPLPAQEPARP